MIHYRRSLPEQALRLSALGRHQRIMEYTLLDLVAQVDGKKNISERAPLPRAVRGQRVAEPETAIP